MNTGITVVGENNDEEWFRVASLDELVANNRLVSYVGISPREIAESPTVVVPGRQAFHMLETPGREVGVHFHVINQFQLFWHGAGKLGREEVGFATVQYADKFTPYGPIVPGPEGVTFLNLRALGNGGALYMPKERKVLEGMLKRPEHAETDRRSPVYDLGSEIETDVWRSFIDDPDGLRISLAVTSPSADIPKDVVGGAGGYFVVLGGEIIVGSDCRPAGSGVWLSAGTRIRSVAAGPHGSRVALLQFPNEDVLVA